MEDILNKMGRKVIKFSFGLLNKIENSGNKQLMY